MLKVVSVANWKWLARKPTPFRTVPPSSFLRFMGSWWNDGARLKSRAETEDTQDSELNVNHTTSTKLTPRSHTHTHAPVFSTLLMICTAYLHNNSGRNVLCVTLKIVINLLLLYETFRWSWFSQVFYKASYSRWSTYIPMYLYKHRYSRQCYLRVYAHMYEMPRSSYSIK